MKTLIDVFDVEDLIADVSIRDEKAGLLNAVNAGMLRVRYGYGMGVRGLRLCQKGLSGLTA